ncbi:MAG: DsbA family protein [Pseudomonadota bacterium]
MAGQQGHVKQAPTTDTEIRLAGIDMRSLIVYIDFKSPYAFLSVEPTRRLGRELGIELDWRPFVLDIPSYLGSAKLNAQGQVASAERTQNQWSGVKYAYYDCRRYANLRSMTVRGTVKIWDTNLASIGMLWAKRAGPEALERYVDAVYVPFWKRELDIEDQSVIESILSAADINCSGFSAFVEGEGRQENLALQEAAFDTGIFGVPTYVLGEQLFFGREHLSRIRWHLLGEEGDPPDVDYPIEPDSVVSPASSRKLQIAIDLDDPQSVLTIDRVVVLADTVSDLELSWHRLPPPRAPAQEDLHDLSRSARHKHYRGQDRASNYQRYCEPVLEGREASEAVAERLARFNIEVTEPRSTEGLAAAAYLREPLFTLDEEIFIGRAHLSLIEARLKLHL